MSDLPIYVLEREFDAPRELVWRTWTEADLLARWYGPNVETVVHQLDVTPGGLWLNEMKWGETPHFQRVEYTEVAPPERLVWLHSVSDAEWNVIDNPMMAGWPRVLLTTVTFAAEGDRTKMRLTWAPHGASAEETAAAIDGLNKGWAAAIDGLNKGWAAGMDLLAELLAEMQA